MCGITGIIAFNDSGKTYLQKIESSVKTLSLRGPEANGIYRDQNVVLGHTRLKILDTSDAAAQPFTDPSGRYTIIYNGEFYNFKEHRTSLEKSGIKFSSTSDTEVLLHLFIQEREKCLEKINGFFAFAIYDRKDQCLFLARDRMGIKPLVIYQDEDKFIFASEIKALLAFGISKEIDEVSLFTYLQLNYIPSPDSIFKNVKKVEAGTFMIVQTGKGKARIQTEKYYKIPFISADKKGQSSGFKLPSPGTYVQAQKKLVELLDESVRKRLISDVPLGSFLSGGIDSSIVTALAAKHTRNLNTFSIGFKDEPFFDETKYAALLAGKYQTNHTVFSLSNNDLFENLHNILDYIDEPFADSSAIAVNILSKYTKKHVSVALSGDGADELFSGYNKHKAEFLARNPGIREKLVKALLPLWKLLPQSRNSRFGNLARQLFRFSSGLNLSPKARYWEWASFMKTEDAKKMFLLNNDMDAKFESRKDEIVRYIDDDFNSVLYTDMHLVLQNDMLVKVDMMSMAHGLEVRVPFLDYNLVNFIFSLPAEFKIDHTMRKKILQDAFRTYLPQEIYNRPKHGFEVPLLKWFRSELKSKIQDDLLSDKFILEQNIFEPGEIINQKARLFSSLPGDSATTVWNLIVFQYWWKKHCR